MRKSIDNLFIKILDQNQIDSRLKKWLVVGDILNFVNKFLNVSLRFCSIKRDSFSVNSRTTSPIWKAGTNWSMLDLFNFTTRKVCLLTRIIMAVVTAVIM